MKKINYRDDFTLVMRLTGSDGTTVEQVPSYDFEVRLLAGVTEFRAGRSGGKLYNCRTQPGEPGALVIVCDGHGLLPCTELEAEVTYHVPDSSYPDGVHRIVRRFKTGVSLTGGLTEAPGSAEFEAMLPFVKLRYEDLTDAEVADLAERMAGKLGVAAGAAVIFTVASNTSGTDTEMYALPAVGGASEYTPPPAYGYGYYGDGAQALYGEFEVDA